MSTCSLRGAALAALVCAGLAAPAAGAAPTGALTATLVPAAGQPAHGMIHLYFSDRSADRAGLRALISGLPPGEPVAFIGLPGFEHSNPLWSGTSDADGNVAVGIQRPLTIVMPDRDGALEGFIVQYGGGDTGTHEVIAPVEPVRPVPAGMAPDVLLTTFHGTSGDGEKFFGMLHYDHGDPGPGVVSYITRVPTCDSALYRFSIVGPSSLKNFMDYTSDDCTHWASGREILVDDTTWDLVARNNSDVVLSRIADDEGHVVASSEGVKVGKLLGVTS